MICLKWRLKEQWLESLGEQWDVISPWKLQTSGTWACESRNKQLLLALRLQLLCPIALGWTTEGMGESRVFLCKKGRAGTWAQGQCHSCAMGCHCDLGRERSLSLQSLSLTWAEMSQLWIEAKTDCKIPGDSLELTLLRQLHFGRSLDLEGAVEIQISEMCKISCWIITSCKSKRVAEDYQCFSGKV